MTTDQYPRRHPHAAFRPMGDEGGLVVLPTRQEVKVLNAVGIRIFAMLDGKHSEPQIAEVVAGEFEVSVEQATADVRGFLDELRENGMLVDGVEVEMSTEDSR